MTQLGRPNILAVDKHMLGGNDQYIPISSSCTVSK